MWQDSTGLQHYWLHCWPLLPTCCNIVYELVFEALLAGTYDDLDRDDDEDDAKRGNVDIDGVAPLADAMMGDAIVCAFEVVAAASSLLLCSPESSSELAVATALAVDASFAAVASFVDVARRAVARVLLEL